MTLLHIIAGLLALAAGTVALYVLKGATVHRRSGMVFVYAMLFMSASGALMAVFKPERISVVAGVLTFYLVCTGLLTMRRSVMEIRALLIGLTLVALTVGVFGIRFGFDAMHSADGKLDGHPAPPYFVFGAVACIAALLDLRMLMAAGIHGTHRLARHLWRMSFAMLIATASFFLGQAKVFPEPLRNFALLGMPVLLVLVVMLYWLVRVLFTRHALTRRAQRGQAIPESSAPRQELPRPTQRVPSRYV